jgi:hypothetical protein
MAMGDLAEIEEYRRLRFLPRAMRRAWARQRKTWRHRINVTNAAVKVWWILVRGYLDTRLGPHVLFAVLMPVVILYVFGAAAVAVLAALWGWSHVAEVDRRQRRDLVRRVAAEELGKFQGRRGYAHLHKDGSETADWWSETLKSFWDGWLEFWLNRLLTRILTNVLANMRLAYLESLSITTFRLGSVAPRINSSRCWRGNEGETILEWDLVWQTQDMQITLSAKVGGAKFAVPVPLRVYVSNLRLAGKFRLGLFWCRRKGGPYLSKLRLSFVDMPEHSVAIKPVTSSFIDVRDLPGVDTAIENALNKLFTNMLVEPNSFTWDVEKWWINRPPKYAPWPTSTGGGGSSGDHGSSPASADDEVMNEAERILQAKGSSISSILAAGAGYSKTPTLMVSMSVHLAEIETDEGPTTHARSYYVKLKRGMKKYTTDAAKAVPQETLVAQPSSPSSAVSNGGGGGGGDGSGGGGVSRRLSMEGVGGGPGHRRRASDGADFFGGFEGGGGGHRRQGSAASDFYSADFSPPLPTPPPVSKKWVSRPVWEEFVRLDAFEREVDTTVDIKVMIDGGAKGSSKTTVGTALIVNLLEYNDGCLHTVQLPLVDVRTQAVVGVLHLRVRVNALNPDVVAAKKDRNPNATLLTAPKTYTTQYVLSAGNYLGKGVNDMSSAMRRNMSNAMGGMPIPQKYVDGAARGVRAAALTAVNEPARHGRWAFRTMYKGCKKFVYGKEKYRRLKKEKVTRELEAAERAAGYSAAWNSTSAPTAPTAPPAVGKSRSASWVRGRSEADTRAGTSSSTDHSSGGGGSSSGGGGSGGGGGGWGGRGGGGGEESGGFVGNLGGGGGGMGAMGAGGVPGASLRSKGLHRVRSIEPSDLPPIEELGTAASAGRARA